MTDHQKKQYFTDDFYRFLLGFTLILTAALLVIGLLTFYQNDQSEPADGDTLPIATTTTTQ